MRNTLSQRDVARLLGQLYVSPTEAARLLRIGRTTLYRMIGTGDIPVQYFRNRPRIPVAWIKERAGITEKGRKTA